MAADALEVLEQALDLAAKQNNVQAAQDIAEQMRQILHRRGESGLPAPQVIGAEGLPAAIKSVASEYSRPEQVLAGVGTAPRRAGQGIAGLVGYEDPQAIMEQQALARATPYTIGGNIAGNAGMFGAVPAAGFSTAMRAIPALRPIGMAVQSSRPLTIVDIAASQGLLAAATEPGGARERTAAGLLSGVISPVAPMMMGTAQGARRMTTGQGKLLGIGEKMLDEYAGARPDDVIEALRTARSTIPGVRVTAAGAARSAPIETLETGSRVRNAGAWIPFDEANANARWAALMERAGTEAERTALRTARDVQTGALRNEAMDFAGNTIAMSRGEFARPIYQQLDNLATGELRPNPQVQKLVSYVSNQLDQQVSPQQLYTVRKVLTGDIKGGVSDELSNAAKSARRETMGLVNSIDEALNKMSGGSWGDYLAAYQSASKTLNSKQALQDLIDNLQKGWGSGTVPPVMGVRPGPYQFGRKVEDTTRAEFGSKVKDLLTPEDRAFVGNLQGDLALSQRGMNAQATIGSPTATYLANAGRARGMEQAILEQGANRIVPLSGTMLGGAFARMGAASSQEAQELLAKALQNPEIMAGLLSDAWIARQLFTGAGRTGAAVGAGAAHGYPSGLLSP